MKRQRRKKPESKLEKIRERSSFRMKKPKSTTPETQADTSKEADSKPYDSEAWRDEVALLEIREQVEKSIPPVSEIAHLAALLTPGNPAAFQNPADAARQAAELWAVCSQQRKTWIDGLACRQLIRAKESAKHNALPQPKKFPVGFDEFLKLALPNKRLEDRMKLFRDMLRARIRNSKCYVGTGGSVIPIERIPVTTDAEVVEAIAKIRAKGFDEDQYTLNLTTLRNSAAYIERQNLKIRGRVAGLKSAQNRAKKKRKARPPVEKLKEALLTQAK